MAVKIIKLLEQKYSAVSSNRDFILVIFML